ncbi:hypothetical protein ACT80S_18600 [Ramlibacter sp. MAHUQ-53]|uniref:hypothetical protein n=1 Tax=unclassified Ramlibacter TaxID=2617605 RepID=UPI003644A93A
MTDQTIKARQQALRDRRARLGLVRVEVWIPASEADRLRKYAQRINSAAEKARNEQPKG